MPYGTEYRRIPGVPGANDSIVTTADVTLHGLDERFTLTIPAHSHGMVQRSTILDTEDHGDVILIRFQGIGGGIATVDAWIPLNKLRRE